MLVRTAADQMPRLNSPSETALAGGSSPIYWMGEFTYKRDAEIYGEKEPAEYVYQVKAGAVRSYKLLSDGRRQIGAFHLPGDIFGLTDGEAHWFTTEAVIDTTLWLLKRRSLETEARADSILSRRLISITTRNLQHAEDHVLLLGRKVALEKVATFLIEMDKRLTSADVITLPMGRRDIADYLGLTVETVSRSLSQLGRAGILTFIGDTHHREITILDRTQLLSLDLQ